ncbi:ABC transporter ATP-binding protein [Gordonia desulfuricans]|uniref:ABC transporter ATP-binding protein n=1 Tax=Gordonia desulfuricans TaxID=89051 RepID=A0A7K3LL23_9ACTN|nr:ABC transporter ATP-binding protein [Gordonia desulfuricans]NDK88741.1 ABC transporter ATP-binding protein [Gordonia desulfuricans]
MTDATTAAVTAGSADDLVLRVADLAVGYRTGAARTTDVIGDICFTVPRSTITVVVGPSGCGKSTLLRAVAGLEPIRRGTVEVAGAGGTAGGRLRTVAAAHTWVPPERRSIGLVPQDGSLFAHLSVARNIGFGVPRADRGARVARLLDLIGMGELADRRPAALSGGQRQRVALARALAPRPALTCLDEPFSALDASLRASLRTEVRRMILDDGGTGLLVTHDREEALAMADQVLVLIDGRIRQIGTPQEVYASPRDAEVAALFGPVSVVDAVADTDRARCTLGEVDLATRGHGPGRLLIRAADVGCRRAHEMDAGAGTVAAVVTGTEYAGDRTVVTAQITGVTAQVTGMSGTANQVTGTVLAEALEPLRPGDDVVLEVRRPLHFVAGDRPGGPV